MRLKINKAYEPALLWQGRYLDLYGGAGSGKSVFAAQKVAIRAMSTQGHRFLVARKIARTIRASCFALIREQVAMMGIPVEINKTEMTITFPNGSEIMHTGLDDVEKLKSIHGVTGIWIEEATELTIDDYTQLNIRMRGETPDYKQIIATYNPIDTFHWIKTHHHDRTDPERLLLKTTFKDNAFIDADYRSVLTSIADENYRRIYAQGEWGLPSQGLIYTHWKTGTPPIQADDTVYGLDFGYNNPSALVRVDIKDADNYVTEELYRSHMTTPDIIEAIKPIVGRHTVYCDAAEPDRIDELRKAGIRARPAKKDVSLGIDHVKRNHLYICGESPNLLKEIRVYKWRDGNDGNPKDREPLKFMDHAMDAMRYAIYTHKRGEGSFY